MPTTTSGRVTVAGVVLAVVAAVLVLNLGDDGTTLAVPPVGEVQADAIGDVPVFVVHAPDGQVHVLDARSSHDVFPKVLAWCRPAMLFEDLWHGSAFDPAGRWLGGPAPTDMAAYEVIGTSAGIVRVGARKPATGRTTTAPGLQEPAAFRCDARTALYGQDHHAVPGVMDDLVVHDDLGRFPDELWFPTPARVRGQAPAYPAGFLDGHS